MKPSSEWKYGIVSLNQKTHSCHFRVNTLSQIIIPEKLWSLFLPYKYVFYKISNKWNYRVCNLLHLPFFTRHKTIHCCMYQFIPFPGWVVCHFIEIPEFFFFYWKKNAFMFKIHLKLIFVYSVRSRLILSHLIICYSTILWKILSLFLHKFTYLTTLFNREFMDLLLE